MHFAKTLGRRAPLCGGLLAAWTLSACAGGADLAAGVVPHGSTQKANPDPGPPPETTPASPPQQVSGAFLACAYMDAPGNVTKSIAAHQPSVEVGCGFYAPQATKPVLMDVTHLHLLPSIFCKDMRLRMLPTRPLAAGSALHVAVTVNLVDLPCTINVSTISLNAASNAKPLAVRRSIPTITQFGGAAGFDVAKDRAGVQTLASSLPAAAGAPTSTDPAGKGVSTPMWATVLDALFASGQTLAQPSATTDNGSQVYQGSGSSDANSTDFISVPPGGTQPDGPVAAADGSASAPVAQGTPIPGGAQPAPGTGGVTGPATAVTPDGSGSGTGTGRTVGNAT